MVISQNNRWDNNITELKPTFVNNSKFTYYHQDNNHFTGGKEYRAIDTRNLNFQSERIKSIITKSVYSDIDKYSSNRIISMSDIIPFIVLGVYWYFCYKIFGV